MEFKAVVDLFRKASEKNFWGSDSYIRLLDDGSGKIVSEGSEYNGDVIFDFYSSEDLIRKLEKSLK